MKEFAYYRMVDVAYPERSKISEEIEKNYSTKSIKFGDVDKIRKEIRDKTTDVYMAMKYKYREAVREKQNEFKRDLEKEFDVVNNPKKDKLYTLAWDMGHANGFSDVYNYYEAMVDLIK